MKTIIDYFLGAKRFGGAFDEDWNQQRIQLERLGGYYDPTVRDLLDLIRLSLRTGTQSFYD